MAFTRSLMKSLGLSEDQGNTLMEEHLNVVNDLKRERDELRTKAEESAQQAARMQQLQTELEELKSGDYKTKYEKEHQDFEAYKADAAKKAEEARVRAAYKDLLAQEKIGEEFRDTILEADAPRFSGLKVGEDGTLSDADKLRESIRAKWAKFIQTESQQGANVQTPPNTDKSTFGSMSLTEKMAYANRNPNAPEVADWLNK